MTIKFLDPKGRSLGTAPAFRAVWIGKRLRRPGDHDYAGKRFVITSMDRVNKVAIARVARGKR